jgi:aryl-alcohol dehydrogenase-like predicted oxidoreductase
VVGAALDAGITYFDVSNRPESTEQHIARLLAGDRDRVVIATKYGSRPAPGVLACAAPDYTRRCVDASLRNLGTDRIDLLYLHRPDPETHIAETLGALGELVAAGKLREIGCSKFSADQLREAHDAVMPGAPGFAAVQNPCSLLELGDLDEVMPLCARIGIGYVAYWPLAAGLLTGKYRRGQALPDGSRFATDAKWQARLAKWHTDARFDAIDRLERWSAERGHTLLDLAFAWLAGQPAVVTMIAGASTPEQVASNAAAASSWTLSAAELDEVTERARQP